MILESRGVPRLNTPPLLSNTSTTIVQERLITAPKPLRIASNLVFEDLSQPWTQSPTKSQMEPVLATWHFVSPDPPLADGSVIGIACSLFQCLIHMTWIRDCFLLFKQYSYICLMSLLIQGKGQFNCSTPGIQADLCNATNPECSPYVLRVIPGKTY
ncbi:uncharacterized protein LOC114284498 [Camellia sinensis]|uniref:uncharacterized protein LOC114284498 n=1 Tax=Camellia sinensis TaxID=4442 RepID=UPI001035FFF8|nr:uncharacterized protein LOC114284498 [Camellia sinensis]